MKIKNNCFISVTIFLLLNGCTTAGAPPSTQPQASADPKVTTPVEPTPKPVIANKTPSSVVIIPSPVSTVSSLSSPAPSPTITPSKPDVLPQKVATNCIPTTVISKDTENLLFPCTEVSTLNIVSGEQGVSDEQMRKKLDYRTMVSDKQSEALYVTGDTETSIYKLEPTADSRTWKATLWFKPQSSGVFENMKFIGLRAFDKDASIYATLYKTGSLLPVLINLNKAKEIQTINYEQRSVTEKGKRLSFISVIPPIGNNLFFINWQSGFSELHSLNLVNQEVQNLETPDNKIVDTLDIVPFKNNKGFYFTQQKCVRTYENGIVKTIAGNCNNNLYKNQSRDGNGSTSLFIGELSRLDVDSKENLYIITSDAGYIKQITHDHIVNTFAGIGIRGCDLPVESTRELYPTHRDGPGYQATIFCPRDIAVTKSDTVFVTEPDNQDIRQIKVTGYSKPKIREPLPWQN